jgi:hypothetical protein
MIWRLIDRLLIQAHIPSLTPVRVAPPSEEPIERPDKRKVLFRVNVDQ